MRGTGDSVFPLTSFSRITPAYAGNSFFLSVRMSLSPGLPLRMRGIADTVLDFLDEVGITPAYAGNRLYGSIFKSSKLARMFPKIH